MNQAGQYHHDWVSHKRVKVSSRVTTMNKKRFILIRKRLDSCNINSQVYFLRTMLLSFALLMLSACGSEIIDETTPPPLTRPTSQIRLYQLGDMLEFSGDVRISKRDEPIFMSAVTVVAEFKPGRLHYQDKKIFTLRTITTFLATGERQIDTQDMWQEADGELFELSNAYGNEYVIGTAFEKGLRAVPAPLVASDKKTIDFFTVYGGAASGPITEGKREISVDATQMIDTPLGHYQANQINHKESYKYLFTYANNKRGKTVETDRKLWVSPDTGIVKKSEVRRILSASGALLSESKWMLELKHLNF